MKVKDYQCVWADNPTVLSERVNELVKKGYELYGPPMFGQSPTLNVKTNSYGNALQWSGKADHTFSQVLIKPEKPKTPKSLPVIQAIKAMGEQSCADCSCAPNLSGEARKSCGRLG